MKFKKKKVMNVEEMKDINCVFSKQVMKISQGSYAIVVPKKIIDEFGIEAGDMIVGVFRFTQKQVKDKNTKLKN